MKDFLALLNPHKIAFSLALCALLLSSLFNAGLTALAEPLMDQVLGSGGQAESRSEKLFGLSEKMAHISEWLADQGVMVQELEVDSKTMTPFAWAILALFIFSGEAFFDFMGTYSLGRIGLCVVVSLRQDIINKVMSLSMSFFGTFNSGEVLTRLNSDVLRVQTAISVKLGEMVKELTRSLMYLMLAFYLQFKLSLGLFVLVPLVGLPIHIFTRKIRKYAAQSQAFLGRLTSRFKEVLVGIRIVKGFQREPFESEKLAAENRNFFKYAMRELMIIALTRPIMGAIGMVMILSFISVGSLMIQSGQMTAGQFIVYVLVIYQLYQPIKRMARANSEIQQAVGVLPRIHEMMRWDNEIKEPVRPTRFKGYPKLKQITFDQVNFHYPSSGKPAAVVLQHLDLTVEQGKVVALVGASGSGKSSLLNLLPRFYDVNAGAVSINNLDIRHMSKHDLRALFAIVTQDTLLFDDTVFNNIAYGIEDTSLEQVREAAKQAFADHFIMDLEKEYQTRIGENGNSLSGGQRQRLAIARAILKNAPVLILDEATSALDSESEKEVQRALDHLMKTKTTLVIAHRLSTIRSADSIVLMDQGRIVERGNHKTLMEKKGSYHKLITMQKEENHALQHDRLR